MRWPAPIRTALFVALGLSFANVAAAQGFWLPAGDATLRDDVTVLADEGVIRLPVTAWPIPVDDVDFALQRVDVESIKEAALQAAYLRVSRRIDAGRAPPGLHEAGLTAGRASLLRGYDEPGREEGELHVLGSATSGPWSATLGVTLAASPQDDRPLRFDGSELSLRWGNWIFSANTLARWWGPGLDGSLIFSNNARPMPGVSIDRVRSTPFSVPLIHWLGPWRFTGLLAVMESHRPDVDRPLFMGMRVSLQPLPILEFGLSRSAQFCGKGRRCDWQTFGRVLVGRDNAGIRVAPEAEPGNQMAGADLRLTSPVKALPAALYIQLIGEDSSSSLIPERYLGLYGVESWWLLEGGSSIRAHLEYSDTACAFQRETPLPNCSYQQGIFFAGYRYHGRVIGHTTDGDAEMRALGLSWSRASGDRWSLTLRSASLDRFLPRDPLNSVTFGPSRYRSAGAAFRGRRWGVDLNAQLGVEEQRYPDVDPRRQAFGFLSVSRPF